MKTGALSFLFLLTLSLAASTATVAAHEEGVDWLVVSHYTGDLRLQTNHFAAQWSDARELDLVQEGLPEISIVGLNNGTHIYFHVRWQDSSANASDNDGLALFFEGAGINGTDDVWRWSTNSSVSNGPGVKADAAWKDGFWNVAIGRTLSAPVPGTVNLAVGEREEGFMVIATWDGSQGQSLEQIDPEAFPHLNVYVLPFIDYYPKDSFFWLSILGLGLVVFTFREVGIFTRREKK